ncbi:hypothetical protein QBC40DRAFT_277582 [Triangularia verruculosa]|uniref:RRM domain-containing protein n=1 Tax=Triangularia verruculosa TaxID=2587418 RepID=A0AAN6XQ42_9PEZI|nr:hypothetical protein QBC40DRAFT_277582 [Triangularia verruculosa]
MSYPGPPGLPKSTSHPSLPPRPPTTKPAGFKPAFKPAFSATPVSAPAPSVPGYSAPPSYTGYGAAAAPGYGAPPSTAPYMGTPSASTVGAGYGQPVAYNYQQQSYPQAPVAQAAPSYYGAPSANSYSAPPVIRNPFAAPVAASAGGAGDYDPEMAAQIAQWQSAYMPKDPSDPANKTAVKGTNGATTDTTDNNAGGDPNEKKKTVYREGGGKKWQDDTLLEWDPTHLRLFVGNLAGETTDDSLLKAFSRWKSVQKAKVVRDKRTTKSKGFGFVSFSDPDDFFQAAKEMNGKYIQSHPVVVRKAKTEIKPQTVKEERKGKHQHKRGSGGNKSGNGMGHEQEKSAGAYQPHLGPAAGGGIVKPGQKTKGGLKLLG